MLNSSSWIDVPKPRTKRAPVPYRGSKAEHRVSASPYSVPVAIRGKYDTNNQKFIIEFKYIADERTTKQKINPDVSFDIGVNSKRIYSIYVDTKRKNNNQINIVVKSAIDKMRIRYPKNKRTKKNIDITQSLLDEKLPEIKKSVLG